jgi:recombination protein RecT
MIDEAHSCHGKVPHGTQQQAQREAERRTEATGEAHEAYKCRFCVDWHVGHTRIQMAATTQITKAAPSLQQLLEASKSQIAMALPTHMTPDRMIRVAITAVQKQPLLAKCTYMSIVGCVIEASQLGLYPDGILGDAYLVPYYNSKAGGYLAQLQPGYRGLINLARRSGQVSSIYSEPVYQCDKFKIELGTAHTIEHVPNYDDPARGVEKDTEGVPLGLRGVYAVVVFKDGTSDFEYMPLFRIMDIRNNSKSKNRDGDIVGPWVSHFEEMARKTPIRRLAKRLPLSPEFQKAAVLDEYVDSGTAPDFTSVVDANSEAMRLATESKSSELDSKYAQSSEGQSAANSDPQSAAGSTPEALPPEIPLTKEQAQAKLQELRAQVAVIEGKSPEGNSVSSTPSEPQEKQQPEEHGLAGVFEQPDKEHSRRRR